MRPASISENRVDGYGRTEVAIAARKDSTAVNPIAAYYLMITMERERELRRPRYESIVPRTSLASRIAYALETFVRLGRPATTQPV